MSENPTNVAVSGQCLLLKYPGRGTTQWRSNWLK